MVVVDERHKEVVNPDLYLRGMLQSDVKIESWSAAARDTYNREEWVAPIPGRPCLTGRYEHENSAR